MAQGPEPPLLAFNDKVNLSDAYKWSRKEIEDFLEDATTKPKDYGVPEGNRDALNAVRTNLLTLVYPDGPEFQIVGPFQHIYREENPEWKTWRTTPKTPGKKGPKRPDEGVTPKCDIRRFPPVDGQEFFGLYDLLGAFLSLMGPAPAAAKAENFYIPLTMMYGRWFRQFHDPTVRELAWQELKPPSVLQCTWKKKSRVKQHDYFLGCSLAGEAACVNRSRTKEPWLLSLQRERFNRVDGTQMKKEGYDFMKSRIPSSSGRVAPKFGNCAETYPFLRLMKNHNVTLEKCFGFALHFSEVDQDAVEPPRIQWYNLVDPCLNCERLIDWYGGNLTYFIDNVALGLDPIPDPDHDPEPDSNG